MSTNTAAHAGLSMYHSLSIVVTGVWLRANYLRTSDKSIFALVRDLEYKQIRGADEHFLILEAPNNAKKHAIFHYYDEL